MAVSEATSPVRPQSPPPPPLPVGLLRRCGLGDDIVQLEASLAPKVHLDAAAQRARFQEAALMSPASCVEAMQDLRPPRAEAEPSASEERDARLWLAELENSRRARSQEMANSASGGTVGEVLEISQRCEELESEGFVLRERLAEIEVVGRARSSRLEEEHSRLANEVASLQAQIDSIAGQAGQKHARFWADFAASAKSPETTALPQGQLPVVSPQASPGASPGTSEDTQRIRIRSESASSEAAASAATADTASTEDMDTATKSIFLKYDEASRRLEAARKGNTQAPQKQAGLVVEEVRGELVVASPTPSPTVTSTSPWLEDVKPPDHIVSSMDAFADQNSGSACGFASLLSTGPEASPPQEAPGPDISTLAMPVSSPQLRAPASSPVARSSAGQTASTLAKMLLELEAKVEQLVEVRPATMPNLTTTNTEASSQVTMGSAPLRPVAAAAVPQFPFSSTNADRNGEALLKVPATLVKSTGETRDATVEANRLVVNGTSGASEIVHQEQAVSEDNAGEDVASTSVEVPDEADITLSPISPGGTQRLIMNASIDAQGPPFAEEAENGLPLHQIGGREDGSVAISVATLAASQAALSPSKGGREDGSVAISVATLAASQAALSPSPAACADEDSGRRPEEESPSDSGKRFQDCHLKPLGLAIRSTESVMLEDEEDVTARPPEVTATVSQPSPRRGDFIPRDLSLPRSVPQVRNFKDGIRAYAFGQATTGDSKDDECEESDYDRSPQVAVKLPGARIAAPRSYHEKVFTRGQSPERPVRSTLSEAGVYSPAASSHAPSGFSGSSYTGPVTKPRLLSAPAVAAGSSKVQVATRGTPVSGYRTISAQHSHVEQELASLNGYVVQRAISSSTSTPGTSLRSSPGGRGYTLNAVPTQHNSYAGYSGYSLPAQTGQAAHGTRIVRHSVAGIIGTGSANCSQAPPTVAASRAGSAYTGYIGGGRSLTVQAGQTFSRTTQSRAGTPMPREVAAARTIDRGTGGSQASPLPQTRQVATAAAAQLRPEARAEPQASPAPLQASPEPQLPPAPEPDPVPSLPAMERVTPRRIKR